MRLRERSVAPKRGRMASGTPATSAAGAAAAADVTLSLPDDLLLMVVREPQIALAMEAVCGRYLRLLRGATLWEPWALAKFPVLRSILGAIRLDGPRCALDYRELYQLHRQLEVRRKGTHFEKVGLLYSAPLATASPPSTLATSLDDYVLTVQIFSYDDVLASSSCAASGLFVKREVGAPSHAVAKLRLPALWSKQTTPGFLAGQTDWSSDQIGAWDMGRMTARILATRVSDMRPLLLYSGAQYTGSSNESYFTKVVLPVSSGGGEDSSKDSQAHPARHSCLAAAVHLTDDEGEVELAILRTIPLRTVQGRPVVHEESGEPGQPMGKYILESACVADVLAYFESGAPWVAQ